MDLADIWPPFGLTIRTGDLEMTPVRETDYPELAETAGAGVCFVNFFPAKRAPKIQPGEHGFQPCELRVRYGERAYPCRAA
ncbi:hypothetical protein ACPUD7_13425, partial [Brevibacterium sp. FAM 24630]